MIQFYKKFRSISYKQQGIKIDSTRYNISDKAKLIEKYHLNSEFGNLAALYFFDSDTNLQEQYIKKWVTGLFNEQHYNLVNYTFGLYYPENYHVMMANYKSKRYTAFLNGMTKSKRLNLTTHLAKLDALFKLKRYNEIAEDSLYLDRKKVPLLLSQLHIRANYKLKNYERIIHFFKNLSNDELTPEIVFIGAQAYMYLKQYDISDSYFNLYITNAQKTEIREFQLAHYYRGLSYQERDRIKLAEDYYKKAIDYNPSYTDLKAFIHKTLGGYYQEKKMYQKALDEWIKYLAVLPPKNSNRESTLERIDILREKAFLHKKKKSSKNKSN